MVAHLKVWGLKKAGGQEQGPAPKGQLPTASDRAPSATGGARTSPAAQRNDELSVPFASRLEKAEDPKPLPTATPSSRSSRLPGVCLPQDVWSAVASYVEDNLTRKNLAGVNRQIREIVSPELAPNKKSLQKLRAWLENVSSKQKTHPPMSPPVAWAVPRLTRLYMDGWLDAVPFDPKRRAYDALCEMFSHAGALEEISLVHMRMRLVDVVKIIESLPASTWAFEITSPKLILWGQQHLPPLGGTPRDLWRSIMAQKNLCALKLSGLEMKDENLPDFGNDFFKTLLALDLSKNLLKNEFDQIRLDVLPKLISLDVSSNEIATDAMSSLLRSGSESLIALNIASNDVQGPFWPVAKETAFPNLKRLDMSNNSIESFVTSLPLSSMSNLKVLKLSALGSQGFRHNVGNFSFEDLQIVDLDLEVLDLQNNQISDRSLRYAPFFYMQKLTELHLDAEGLTAEGIFRSPILHLSSLRELYLYRLPSDVARQQLLEAMTKHARTAALSFIYLDSFEYDIRPCREEHTSKGDTPNLRRSFEQPRSEGNRPFDFPSLV